MIKNHTETLVFTILDILQLKTDDGKSIHSVNPLHLRIDEANGYIEEKGMNKYLGFDSTDGKSYLKNTMVFLMELGIKLKK